ncbi:MAG: MFS transporter [Bryobacterales bacterium]|jgi:MFS family permease|nr:MFS transporter [Bryobacterales bacterium]
MDPKPLSARIKQYATLLRENRNFRLLWLAQIVSELGDWFYAVALYSLLLDLTGSAKSIGIAIVLQVLPQVLIAPAAGALNDRLSRKKLMIFADIIRVFVVLAMVTIRSADMVWIIYLLLPLETMAWGLFEPGRAAVVPTILSRQHLIIGNALSAATWSFNLAVGATLGGLVAVAFGRSTAFVVNAGTFLLSAWFISRMRFHEEHTHGRPPFRLRELVDFTPAMDGFRYMKDDPKRLSVLCLKGGLGLMGAHNVLLPIFGERVFPMSQILPDASRAGMMGMSVLMAWRGVGALLGPLIGATWAGDSRRRMRIGIAIGFGMTVCGYSLLSLAPNATLAGLCIVLAHAGGSIIWVFSTTLLMLLTENRFRGRVFSAEYAVHFMMVSTASYGASSAIDLGMTPQRAALTMGLTLLIPLLLWLGVQRFWKNTHDTPLADDADH